MQSSVNTAQRLRNGLLVCLLCTTLAAPAWADEAELHQELGHGYAMLHTALKQLQHVDLALLFKKESPAVRDLIRQLADTSDALEQSLSELARGTPVIDLTDQGLTRFELEKRRSLTIDRGLGLGTPFLGRTGADLERTALLSLAAAVNQQRHLIKVMLPDEEHPARRDWLERSKKDLDGIYERFTGLLEQEYFCVAKQ